MSQQYIVINCYRIEIERMRAKRIEFNDVLWLKKKNWLRSVFSCNYLEVPLIQCVKLPFRPITQIKKKQQQQNNTQKLSHTHTLHSHCFSLKMRKSYLINNFDWLNANWGHWLCFCTVTAIASRLRVVIWRRKPERERVREFVIG